MDMQMPELDGYGAAARAAHARLTHADHRADRQRDGRRPRQVHRRRVHRLPRQADRQRQQLLATAATYIRKDTTAADSSAAPHAPLTATSTIGADPKYKKLLEKFVSRLPDRVTTLSKLLQEQNLTELERAYTNSKVRVTATASAPSRTWRPGRRSRSAPPAASIPSAPKSAASST